MNKLRRIFNPTVAEQRKDNHWLAKLIRENIKRKACSTCIHYIAVPGYHPGFVTGADEDCDTERCPIETCEDYKLNPSELDRIRELENS